MPEGFWLSRKTMRQWATWRRVLGVLGGALVGFLYQHFIGCHTGACPLTSNPFLSTLYGGLLGLLVARV